MSEHSRNTSGSELGRTSSSWESDLFFEHESNGHQDEEREDGHHPCSRQWSPHRPDWIKTRRSTSRRMPYMYNIQVVLCELFAFLLGVFVGCALLTLAVCTWNETVEARSNSAADRHLTTSSAIDLEGSAQSQLYVGVLSAAKFMKTRVTAVHNAWGKELSQHIEFYVGRPMGAQDSEVRDLKVAFKKNFGVEVVHLNGASENEYPPQRKMFLMMKSMCRHLGRYQWYFRADDDVFVRVSHLRKWLQKLDPNELHYIGSFGFGRASVAERLGLKASFCMGGPGVIMSHGAMEQLCPHISECMDEVVTGEEDTELGRCVMQHLGIRCTTAYEFFRLFHHSYPQEYLGLPHPYMEDLNPLIGVDPLTVHHLKEPHLMFRLAAFFAQHATPKLNHSIAHIRAKMAYEQKLSAALKKIVKKATKTVLPVFTPPQIMHRPNGVAHARGSANVWEAIVGPNQSNFGLMHAMKPEHYNSDPQRFVASTLVKSALRALTPRDQINLALWSCSYNDTDNDVRYNLTLDLTTRNEGLVNHRQISVAALLSPPIFTAIQKPAAVKNVAIVVRCSVKSAIRAMLAVVHSKSTPPQRTAVHVHRCTKTRILDASLQKAFLTAGVLLKEMDAAGTHLAAAVKQSLKTLHQSAKDDDGLFMVADSLPAGVKLSDHFIASCNAMSSGESVFVVAPFKTATKQVVTGSHIACMRMAVAKELFMSSDPLSTESSLPNLLHRLASQKLKKLKIHYAVDVLVSV